MRPTSTTLICSRKTSTPRASMASKVTPSMPGAPFFSLANAYASRSASILQTWTYKPQKRQDVSAFALTYSLRLRSCKSMDAFVISSLPSRLKRHSRQKGPFAPRALPHFIAHTDPSATLSPSTAFPVYASYTIYLAPVISHRDERASPVARCVLVAVLSLPPRRSEGCRIGQISAPHAAFALSKWARPSDQSFFEATLRSLSLRPGDS